MGNAWAIRELSAGYGERCVLEPLDLDLPLGQTACIVGPGGSGKTTLIRALAKRELPEAMWVRGTSTPPPDKTVWLPQRSQTGDVDWLPMLDHIPAESIVLLDEPFVQLPEDRHEALHWRLADLRKLSHTVICVTHNLRHARRISDYVVLLADGKLVESAPADAFFDEPKQPRTVDFLRTGS